MPAEIPSQRAVGPEVRSCGMKVPLQQECWLDAPLTTPAFLSISSKPVQSHLKLHGVYSRIRDSQTSIGDVLIANTGGESAAVVIEKLKAQSRMRYKIYVGRIHRYCVIAEKYSTTEFKIRDSTRGAGEVPLQVKRIKRRSIGILSGSWLPQVVKRDEIGGPFKIAAQEAAKMIVRKDLAQPSADVDGVRIFCSSGNAESAASPDAEVPGLAIERLGGLGAHHGRAKDEHENQNPTTEAQRHGEQQLPDDG